MAHLDHIIVLVHYAQLADPPTWVTQNFTISPGGRHADGKTENRLICFRDGSYVELIAFVNDDPENREGHVWGKKQFGIIDFAFTHENGDAVALFSELKERLERLEPPKDAVKVAYEAPIPGGRKRPDGQDVKWTVTNPLVTTGYQRGELPFFCHDKTPRPVRVPTSEEAVTHPSSAYGIKQLNIYVPESRVKVLTQAYAAILGTSNTPREDSSGVFKLERLRKVDGTEKATFSLQTPAKQWQVDAVNERGGYFLGALTFGGQASEGNKSSTRIDDGKGGFGEISLDLD